MSDWTHVAGVVRIDYLAVLSPSLDFKDELRRRFGNTANYGDPPEKWDVCDVPCGSEGSLQYEIIKTGTDNHLSWGLVAIWGDLRDYTDSEAIYQWILDSTDGLMIRNGIVEVWVEGHQASDIIIHEQDGGWMYFPNAYITGR